MNTYFEVEGLTIGDKVDLISGVLDPRSGVGISARTGSMYLRSNGETWKKIGIGDRDWGIESSSTTPTNVVLRSILVTDDSIVDLDVGVISFNHYYTDGVKCGLGAPSQYNHPVTIKNLSGMPLTIDTDVGRIEGKKTHTLLNKFSSVTLNPLQNDWIIISEVIGIKPS